jgi:hypothetical protein
MDRHLSRTVGLLLLLLLLLLRDLSGGFSTRTSICSPLLVFFMTANEADLEPAATAVTAFHVAQLLLLLLLLLLWLQLLPLPLLWQRQGYLVRPNVVGFHR